MRDIKLQLFGNTALHNSNRSVFLGKDRQCNIDCGLLVPPETLPFLTQYCVPVLTEIIIMSGSIRRNRETNITINTALLAMIVYIH
jgi:hypothetical protein